MFENFFGNAQAAATLEQMIDGERIPQTMIFAGQGGLGKGYSRQAFRAAPARSSRKDPSTTI